MAKKTFVRAGSIKKGSRWHLDFTIYQGETGEELRKRMDFGLNEIADLTIRAAVAERMLQFLQQLDFEKLLQSPSQRQGPTLAEAVSAALDLKTKSDRRNTNDTYNSTVNTFLKWANRAGWGSKPFAAFQKDEARAFIEALRKKKLAPRTVNNYRNVLRSVWGEIADGDPLVLNPWKAVKLLQVHEKKRRIFTEQEREVIARHIEATDYWLFRGILLQYYCFIRPCELSRLKFRNFDLARGLVKIHWFEGKTKKEGWCTIPQSILPYFTDGVFEKQPANYYLFGHKGDGRRRKDDRMGPAALPARDDRAYKKHVKVLNKLHAAGLLSNIEGLTWYSWKDTGISTHVHSTSPLATRDQARHTDFETTLIYYHKDEVNPEYRALPHNLYG